MNRILLTAVALLAFILALFQIQTLSQEKNALELKLEKEKKKCEVYLKFSFDEIDRTNYNPKGEIINEDEDAKN